MNITVGTDIIDISRVERARDALVRRVFTHNEVDYCTAHTHSIQAMAARFAAKEAVFKALRMPAPTGISWKDIEIYNDDNGVPHVKLYRNALAWTHDNHLIQLDISISHSPEYATATAVCLWNASL